MTVNEASRPDFSIYLLEELKRLDARVTESLEMKDIKEDATMQEATVQVLQKLRNINVSSVSEKSLMTVLKIKNLEREYQNED